MFPCVRADLDAEKRERKGGLIKAGLLLISRRIQSKKDIEKTSEGIRERCALWSFRNPDDYPTLMSVLLCTFSTVLTVEKERKKKEKRQQATRNGLFSMIW
ncbi:hypothetical protein OUZ56_019196 [Daphnia magna]|uniref:Uncharacterized protein n=1 Tax=Daphnia magna TaxID=35525 RepID=A0ABQ9ZAX3_9CRUS|nr:hypothetical protein OUZ56_019196 [Daphnia magna]